MQQAREFDKALDLDALVVTKLDGTAKGGIALAISHELDLPIAKIGVGEGIDDLRDFDAHDFARALIGDFEEEDLLDDEEEQADEKTASTSERDAFEEIDVGASEAEPQDDVHADVAELDEVCEAEEDTSSEEVEPDSDETDAPQKMSWAEFVEADDARKAVEPQKKHFWDKW